MLDLLCSCTPQFLVRNPSEGWTLSLPKPSNGGTNTSPNTSITLVHPPSTEPHPLLSLVTHSASSCSRAHIPSPLTLRNGYHTYSPFLHTQPNGHCIPQPFCLRPQSPYDGGHEHLANYALDNSTEHVPLGLSSFALASPLSSPSTLRQPRVE